MSRNDTFCCALQENWVSLLVFATLQDMLQCVMCFFYSLRHGTLVNIAEKIANCLIWQRTLFGRLSDEKYITSKYNQLSLCGLDEALPCESVALSLWHCTVLVVWFTLQNDNLANAIIIFQRTYSSHTHASAYQILLTFTPSVKQDNDLVVIFVSGY